MKTLTLADALRSGKDFTTKMNGTSVNWKCDMAKHIGWSANEILHAECQIIEEPIERWAWIDMSGEVTGWYKTEDHCMGYWKGCAGRPVKFREVCDE